MSLKVPKANNIQLFKDGYKHLQGIEEAVMRNIQAVGELSDLVRTSFGPNASFRKEQTYHNHLGRMFVTSDAATIIREIEVVHPAAKLLVMASQAQESEVRYDYGRRDKYCTCFAGELLKKSEHLLIMGLHPSEIIIGYELACEKALAELEGLSNYNLAKPLTKESLALVLKSSIASKQYGSEDTLASLVAEAALAVMPSRPEHFNVDNVRVVKIMGGSLNSSTVVRGMVFNREPQGVIKKASKAKVAVYTCALDIAQTETKGTVLLRNAEEMLNFTRGEEQQLEKYFKEIADSGVQVIVAGAAVGELAMHYLDRFSILVIKVLSKFDLRRLCRVVGATPLARLGAPTAEEAGSVDIVETVEIGGDRVTVFRQDPPAGSAAEKSKTATIVLRGATANTLDDMERAIDDGVNVIKALVKDDRLVPGAGATEIELAKRVESYGAGLKGLSQHAVRRYASALEILPSTLAENAGLDMTEVVSKLYEKHAQAGGATWGVDIEEEQIYDSLSAKSWAIKLATEAAVSVLRVDSIIMSKPADTIGPHWHYSISSGGLYPFLVASGRDPHDLIAHVSFAPQRLASGGAFYDFTARYGAVREEDRMTLRESLGTVDESLAETLDLKRLLDLPLVALSNGQTRRARILQALMRNPAPEVLVLTEPLTGLDVEHRPRLLKLLHDLHIKRAPRVIMTLRGQDPVPDWATHIIRAENGKIIVGERSQMVSKHSKRDHKPNDGYKGDPHKIGKPIVEIVGLNIAYHERKILTNVNWTIREGERWHLKGPNGSGKTTLLAMITGDHPQSYSQPASSLRLFSKPRRSIPTTTLQRRIGLISPEQYNAFPRRYLALVYGMLLVRDLIRPMHSERVRRRRSSDRRAYSRV
ncbi:TCP-1/cpn60 chaperonin family (T-complex protein 1) [Rhizoctonia solani]|uniref:TCP-1/cpn60 chaperonin family (T-complex protein 1) n=1 Tax=Rhizoctonia solani TaxID=456999 RepID=A0A8H8P534_9AGAM|nr:TCP-1/cpn60 chaperonin family (T-complex protein 1) [Rhizoctonia solani]QRW25325.1 TCP-1/cpn60 chaperonin family (T-complex protein 1) [Rhizoctonia solani]